MGIGASIFLLATGAILNWGVTADVEGVDLGVIGVILMFVGAFGLLLSLLWWADWGPWQPRRDYVDDTARERRFVDAGEPDGRRGGGHEDPVVERHTATTRRDHR